ncbi:hypothetical protein PAMP_010023 [Pampus punctatissimus]
MTSPERKTLQVRTSSLNCEINVGTERPPRRDTEWSSQWPLLSSSGSAPVSGVSDRRWGVSAGDSDGETELRQVGLKQPQ